MSRDALPSTTPVRLIASAASPTGTDAHIPVGGVVNIVVRYLETNQGRTAVERAVAVARERGATLHLVGVIESPRNDKEAPA